MLLYPGELYRLLGASSLYIVIDSLLPIENDIATLYHRVTWIYSILDIYLIFYILESFLAHLTRRIRGAIASLGVRRKLFQKSSPLKVLDQWKLNLV